MVVVDEAHSAVSGGRGRQRRYELVRSLADDRERHLILLTATPHSGNETAFHNLLGLIDTEFAHLPDLTGEAQRRLREKLAAHFIQRRRRDIDAGTSRDYFHGTRPPSSNIGSRAILQTSTAGFSTIAPRSSCRPRAMRGNAWLSGARSR